MCITATWQIPSVRDVGLKRRVGESRAKALSKICGISESSRCYVRGLHIKDEDHTNSCAVATTDLTLGLRNM